MMHVVLISNVLFSYMLISNVLLYLINCGESPPCFVIKFSAARGAAAGRRRSTRGDVALGDADSN